MKEKLIDLILEHIIPIFLNRLSEEELDAGLKRWAAKHLTAEELLNEANDLGKIFTKLWKKVF